MNNLHIHGVTKPTYAVNKVNDDLWVTRVFFKLETGSIVEIVLMHKTEADAARVERQIVRAGWSWEEETHVGHVNSSHHRVVDVSIGEGASSTELLVAVKGSSRADARYNLYPAKGAKA